MVWHGTWINRPFLGMDILHAQSDPERCSPRIGSFSSKTKVVCGDARLRSEKTNVEDAMGKLVSIVKLFYHFA